MATAGPSIRKVVFDLKPASLKEERRLHEEAPHAGVAAAIAGRRSATPPPPAPDRAGGPPEDAAADQGVVGRHPRSSAWRVAPRRKPHDAGRVIDGPARYQLFESGAGRIARHLLSLRPAATPVSDVEQSRQDDPEPVKPAQTAGLPQD